MESTTFCKKPPFPEADAKRMLRYMNENDTSLIFTDEDLRIIGHEVITPSPYENYIEGNEDKNGWMVQERHLRELYPHLS